ncbi:putative bacitracin resistance protein [Opitutaceae bacterium TAV1]|nr:putative bacitracin resistance protein [Opitutaceae bacterium TAV1]
MTFFRSRLRLATAFLATSCAALATPDDAAASDPATPARTEIVRASDPPDALDAIVLGIVEGVTEYLPVSSTGHLVIANHFLDLESTVPLYDGEGQMLWAKKPSPKHPEGEPLTIKAAADAYAVIIQAGAIAAVGLIYWRRLLQIARGLFGNSPDGVRLLRNIVLACIPPGLAGLLLGDFIDSHLFSIRTVAWALVAGSVLMVAAEWWRKRQPRRIVEYTGEDLKAGQALFIGFAQCLALWPGMSRSMVTMVAGYFTGMRPARSAEFSFLAGFALLSAAALYKSWKAGPAVIEVFGWSNTLLGMLVATIAAVIAIKGFVGYLSRHGLGIFAIYRLALAAVLFVWFV